MLDKSSIPLLQEALQILEQGFGAMPEFAPETAPEALRAVLMEAARRMQENYPYPHPLYAGQMLKPPHSIARLAYALALWINPNNHALDGGRASSAMEKEAVAELARLFGWETHLGHLCGGGTVANMEALWIAGEVTGKHTVIASSQAHYTHPRLCAVLGLPFEAIPTDDRARMDIEALEDRLKHGDVGTVVVTLGTTATGSCDPLPEILCLRERFGFRLHCDTAYGGYFTLADNLRPETRAAFDLLREADSIVVDPHKHGLQPYGCGCVLFRDPAVGRYYKHDSPYTYFSSAELHLGEISLECSRPGASAVALWATQQLLPYTANGEFAGMLSDCRRAALDLHARLESDTRFLPAFSPELDIVIWTLQAGNAREASRLNRLLFAEAAKRHLHLALANLPVNLFRERWALEGDEETITCLRSCLMKPEHHAWLNTLWETLSVAADAVSRQEDG